MGEESLYKIGTLMRPHRRFTGDTHCLNYQQDDYECLFIKPWKLPEIFNQHIVALGRQRMIKKITIQDQASYGDTPQYFDNLSKFNFIYGSNGTGKTTVSRVIADESKYDSCNLTWQNGRVLQTLVYNRDFVEEHFNQPIKGIFTLGKQDKEILEKIRMAKEEQNKLESDITSLQTVLEGEYGNAGKLKELADLESDFENKCWSSKQIYQNQFKEAFRGVLDSKRKFKDRLLKENKDNTSEAKDLEELKSKSITVFGDTPETKTPIPTLSYGQLLQLESDPILNKKVVGKSDVDIAAMIEKLGNSDWVKQGKVFYESNDGFCPFCQQKTAKSFAASLNEYFDESFENDTLAIKTLLANYKAESKQLQDAMQSIIDTASSFIDIDKLKSENELLGANIRMNIQSIEKKQSESSQVITLDPLKDIIGTIEKCIESANNKIAQHNAMVDNLDTEKRVLSGQVWRYLLDHDIKNELSAYQSRKEGINKAIESLKKQIESKSGERAKKVTEIRELEKDTTSIQPTVDGINGLLKSFGFTGFKLAKSTQDMFYKIQRPDGSDAQETLSEGEKSFITFLYFYHLLKGSNSESGITTDRIVVFDDPVSSLDSDILFIVSSLIKRLFDEVREETGNIKQIFVLTHNVYFHKEVSYNNDRCKDRSFKDETFWIINKVNRSSTVQNHKLNPIKTSYELLWNEVRDESNRSNLTIQNTLRRIIENYFKILGGINRDEICNMFEGEDKVICGSLFSWINDGSHFVNDDLYISSDTSLVEKQLRVFQEIFNKSGHVAHYNMMMGITEDLS